MAFFHFSQNNSGGSFDFSLSDGITHHVVIEAKDAEDANVIAIAKGLYFDGCASGLDCSCCGDRWYRQYRDEDGDDSPKVYDEPVHAAKVSCWMEPGREIAVHYIDGRVEWFGAEAA